MLGAERYADYQHAKLSEHYALNRLVERLELPIAAARAVVAVQHDATAPAASFRANATLTPEQRAAHFDALSQESGAKISAALGPRGLAAYKATSGQWLQSLNAPSSSPAEPATGLILLPRTGRP